MAKANRAQLKIPATLPTLRAARKDWRITLAEEEEHEKAVDEAAALLSQAKADLVEAQKRHRQAEWVLREVEDRDPQEDLPRRKE